MKLFSGNEENKNASFSENRIEFARDFTVGKI